MSYLVNVVSGCDRLINTFRFGQTELLAKGERICIKKNLNARKWCFKQEMLMHKKWHKVKFYVLLLYRETSNF